jgi:hypothetical protein
MTYRSTFKLTECGVLSESPMEGWLRWWAMSAGVMSDGARSGPTLARLVLACAQNLLKAASDDSPNIKRQPHLN